MKENKEKIEQIMQQFYEKQEEINKLINANKNEIANAKLEILDLKQKRADERKNLKAQEEALNERKKVLLEQNIDDSEVSINGVKGVLTQEQSQAEQELIDKIEKINEKERYIVCLKNQLTNLNNRKEELIQQYLTGEEENDSLLRTSFENQYNEAENELISKINALTEEISKKYLLEEELRKIRLDKDKDKTELETNRINSSLVQKSLVNFFNSKEIEFAARKKELMKETAEEKELKKAIKEIEKRPDYTNVYLKEMFDLKFEFRNLITSEKIDVEFLLKSKVAEKQIISRRVEEAREAKELELNSISDRLTDIKENLKTAAIEMAETEELEEIEKYKNLIDELSKDRTILKEKEIILKNEIEQISVDTTDLDSEISNIQTFLEEITADLVNLQPTKEETDTVSMEFNQIEQDEYDRRLIIRNKERLQKQQETRRLELQREEEKRLEEQRIEEEKTRIEQEKKIAESKNAEEYKKVEDILNEFSRKPKESAAKQIEEDKPTTLYREGNNTSDIIAKLREVDEENNRKPNYFEKVTESESIDNEILGTVSKQIEEDKPTTLYREGNNTSDIIAKLREVDEENNRKPNYFEKVTESEPIDSGISVAFQKIVEQQNLESDNIDSLTDNNESFTKDIESQDLVHYNSSKETYSEEKYTEEAELIDLDLAAISKKLMPEEVSIEESECLPQEEIRLLDDTKVYTGSKKTKSKPRFEDIIKDRDSDSILIDFAEEPVKQELVKHR